jgi:hypothetical protein
MCRLGRTHDGGYVVPLEAITKAKHLVSFGLATNWDFERDALAANPRLSIEAYDPAVNARRFMAMGARSAISIPLRLAVADVRGARSSLRRAWVARDYFRFFSGPVTHTSKRVWYNTDRGSVAIAEILERVHRSKLAPAFLKVDIEGSEYRILPWICDASEVFTGMVIEFHHTDICADQFNMCLERLRANFAVVHVHGNNYGDLSVDGSLPLSLEVTLLHRHLANANSRVAIGESTSALDAPNDPRRPDYVLDLSGLRPVSRSLVAGGSRD